MRYLALATDYDGTIADGGVVDKPTLAALERLRAGGRRLFLVTGRALVDLQRAMPRLDLFDLVVAENGAVLFDPANRREQTLGDAPAPAFVARLRELGVEPLWLGRVVVATSESNEGKVLKAIREFGLNLQITRNKGAVMVLPAGVTKASGLRRALAQHGLSPHDCIGVGDAENDLAFLDVCGLGVAVGNALLSVKQRTAFVTTGTHGAGVAELIDRLLATDFAAFDATGQRARLALVTDEQDTPALSIPRQKGSCSRLRAGELGRGVTLPNAIEPASALPRFTTAATTMTAGIVLDESKVKTLFEGDTEQPRPPPPPAMIPTRTLRERLRRPLLVLFPILLAAIGTAYYLSELPYVSTDDAFVRAAKESVNARVAGQVVKISVVDNQRVQQGQLLFQIDPEPYQIAVDQADARLGSARLQIDQLKATYRQQQAELQSARDSADYDQREYARKKALVAADWTPRAVYERAETDLKVARQHVVSIEQQIANTVIALNGDPNIDIDRHPSVRAAKAQLDRARLDLSYAAVMAPDDGIVTRVDDLQVGDFVSPGAAVFSLLSSRRVWVEANFRETGLTHMRPGQDATIDVDAYPGRLFKAHVVSMSPGTGSDFAVLPPENATGNWVKVVQRLPVRLELDEIDPTWTLFSGISVTVRVDTGRLHTRHHPLQAAFATQAAK